MGVVRRTHVDTPPNMVTAQCSARYNTDQSSALNETISPSSGFSAVSRHSSRRNTNKR